MTINQISPCHGEARTYTFQRDSSRGFHEPAVSPSLWNSTDTVEISGRNDATAGSESERAAAPATTGKNFTMEDLAALKRRFSELSGQRKSIDAKLKKLAKSCGAEIGVNEQMRIEIDSTGKVIVGGLQDGKKAKELEKAINRDKKLVNEIAAFQEEEAFVSRELHSVTGKSLQDYAARIAYLQKGGFIDDLPQAGAETVFSRDDRIALKDQEISLVDGEFGSMLSDYLSSWPTQNAFFSGGKNILENADKTVEKEFTSILRDVGRHFAEYNKGVRAAYATDPEEMKKRLVSLRNLVITVGSDGAVLVEGSACEDFRTDMMTKKMVQEMFHQALKRNPYTGEREDFFLAAQHLENQYDLAFAGQDSGRKLLTTFRDGRVQSRVSSPGEEARLREEIAVHAKTALSAMDIGTERLQLDSDEKGKIVVRNMPEDGMEARKIDRALKLLNTMIQNRSNKDFNNIGDATRTVDRLKGLMAKLDVHLPGGASLLMAMRPAMAGGGERN